MGFKARNFNGASKIKRELTKEIRAQQKIVNDLFWENTAMRSVLYGIEAPKTPKRKPTIAQK